MSFLACFSDRCVYQFRHSGIGATEGTRTLDILIDNQALFQLSYDRVVKPAGIEPALPD